MKKLKSIMKRKRSINSSNNSGIKIKEMEEEVEDAKEKTTGTTIRDTEEASMTMPSHRNSSRSMKKKRNSEITCFKMLMKGLSSARVENQLRVLNTEQW